MSNENIAIEKLRRIEHVWEKLKEFKSNTPEYAGLIKQIGALSTEYQNLVEAAKKSNGGPTAYATRKAEVLPMAGSPAGSIAGIKSR